MSSTKQPNQAFGLLSKEANAELDKMAKRFKVSREQMVERLIFGTAPEQPQE